MKKNESDDITRKWLPFLLLFSEESRMHVHITCPDGEAKFWLDPEIEPAKNYNLSRTQLKEIEKIIEVHYNEFKDAWEKHRES